jgi:hypothetical protein
MMKTRFALRLAGVSVLLATTLPVLAALPAPSEEAKAKAAEAAATAAWAGKVQAFELCKVEDRIAGAYRKNAQAAGKTVPAALETPACSDPGPFGAAAGAAPKPIEASEAHSPAATATTPPSTNTPAAALPASGNK